MTLAARGALRGCIGRIAADRPLGDVVRDMTVAAARDDPRFPPVAPDEMQLLEQLDGLAGQELVPDLLCFRLFHRRGA